MLKIQRGGPGISRFILGAVFLGPAFAQTSPLVLIEEIPVPGWTNTGSTQANFDLFAFNPRTQVMYVADRTNHAVTAIDTIRDGVIGVLPIPSGGSTNGVVVAIDEQKLAVTDGQAHLYVYDLRVPAVPPEAYVIPQITAGTDALDYDPLNHTVYVINGTAPYFMTGIDLVNHNVRSQFALPGSPELMRFNPNDGLIYQVITTSGSEGLYAFDPVANTITAKYLTPGCTPHGVEIDPVTNVALLGCSPGGQVMLDLSHGGANIMTFNNITGTDLTGYNNNTRNFYTGSGSNNLVANGCPADSTNAFPLIGVFDSTGPGLGTLLGITCTGRNAHGLGVDPIDNFVYVGTRQYPVNASDATTGQNGVLVYWDSAPRSDATPGSKAVLTGLDGKTSLGTILFNTSEHRGLRGAATLQGVSGATALVNVPTSLGNETVPCAVGSGSAVCDGPLLGAPLIGATALLAVDGAPAGRGSIQ